ncbi:helix-turn-helix transcriptional regulator [Streptosporangium sp. NPDC051022]|uniref:helix-turn-helix domain-containing protein n=1 Tax=Streptosporangium sp. NPDC051022 TaxID=3155752 RepID=UPI003418ACC7
MEDSFAMERAVLSDLLRRMVSASGLQMSQIANQARIPATRLSAMMSGHLIPRQEVLESLLEACDAVPTLRFDIRYSWERLRDLQLRSGQHLGPEDPETRKSGSPTPQAGAAPTEAAFQAKGTLPPLREDALGYELKPDPLIATTKEELLELMRDFHIWAGEPSYREIAINAGRSVGASTLCEALNVNKPIRLPSLKVVTAFIHGCGGNEAELVRWTTAWRRIRMARGHGNAPPSAHRQPVARGLKTQEHNPRRADHTMIRPPPDDPAKVCDPGTIGRSEA